MMSTYRCFSPLEVVLILVTYRASLKMMASHARSWVLMQKEVELLAKIHLFCKATPYLKELALFTWYFRLITYNSSLYILRGELTKWLPKTIVRLQFSSKMSRQINDAPLAREDMRKQEHFSGWSTQPLIEDTSVTLIRFLEPRSQFRFLLISSQELIQVEGIGHWAAPSDGRQEDIDLCEAFSIWTFSSLEVPEEF